MAGVHRHDRRTRETRRDARRVKVDAFVYIWHKRLMAEGGPEGSGPVDLLLRDLGSNFGLNARRIRVSMMIQARGILY